MLFVKLLKVILTRYKIKISVGIVIFSSKIWSIIGQSLPKVVNIFCNPWGSFNFRNNPRTSPVNLFQHIVKYSQINGTGIMSSASDNVRVHTKCRLAITNNLISEITQSLYIMYIFSECARVLQAGDAIDDSFARERRAGWSKKPFPDGTQQSRLNQRTSSRALLLCSSASVCAHLTRTKKPLSLECGWWLRHERFAQLALQVRARVPTKLRVYVKLITFHSQSVQNYRLGVRECDLDVGSCAWCTTWCAPLPWYTSGWPCLAEVKDTQSLRRRTILHWNGKWSIKRFLRQMTMIFFQI